MAKGKKSKSDKVKAKKTKGGKGATEDVSVNVAEALTAMVTAVNDMKASTGLNQRAVIALIHDHTKIPKKVIRSVLDGSVEALAKYTGRDNDQPEDDSEE